MICEEDSLPPFYIRRVTTIGNMLLEITVTTLLAIGLAKGPIHRWWIKDRTVDLGPDCEVDFSGNEACCARGEMTIAGKPCEVGLWYPLPKDYVLTTGKRKWTVTLPRESRELARITMRTQSQPIACGFVKLVREYELSYSQ
jgi:hypothetical protein